MTITIINGSPNAKGTCSRIIESLQSRIDPDNHVTAFNLNTMNIHGCQECFACRNAKSDTCFYKDDVSAALEKVKTTDVLILASPIFYGDVTAQAKCFIDRTWAYFGRNGQTATHLKQNRKIVFLLSFGYTDTDHYDAILQKYAMYFKLFGFSNVESIKACGAQYFNNVPVNNEEIEQSISRTVKFINL